MAKGRKRSRAEAKKAASARLAALPKKKCCESKVRCNRCPLRMLKEGTLPSGYTVKKRKLIEVPPAAASAPGTKQGKKQKTAA